jgi:putative transposase
MGWFILVQIFSVLIAIVSLGRLSEREKDLEILVLRQQLAILKRKQSQPIRANRVEKMTLALLTAKLKEATQRPASRLRDIIRIFQPETVLGWHRELVRRKWSHARKNKSGRPRIDQELEDLILRLARENPRWGYDKIEGELLKLGFQASPTTVRNVLKRHGITPAPRPQWFHWLAASDDALQGTTPGLRLLHHGDNLVADPVCALLHRTGGTPGAPG